VQQQDVAQGNIQGAEMATARFFRHSTQFFQHYIPTEFIILGIFEFAVLFSAFCAAVDIRFSGGNWPKDFGSVYPRAFMFAVIMQMCLIALAAYQRHSRQTLEYLALRVGGSLVLGLVPLGLIYYLFPQFELGRGGVAIAVAFSFVLIMIDRVFFRRIEEDRDMRVKVLVLGAGSAASLVREARDSGELDGLNIVGFVPLSGDLEGEGKDDIVTFDEPLIEFVARTRIDEIVLAADDRRKGLPVQGLLDCKMSGIEVLDLLTFFERETGKIRLDILSPSWLYLSDGFRDSAFGRLSKRLFDLTICLLLLPLALPLMVIIALVSLVDSNFREPVLYRQTRVSENGKPFTIYKFRSMCSGAEEDGVARWAEKNDSRITRLGSVLRKCRLDELPQLFNVLKGDMSFVGPRPERPEFVEQLSTAIPYYNERHRVKPGLTGWAQIRYAYGASEEDGLEKLQYDLYYVKNYSIMIDLLILLQTAEVVLLGKGAH